jgi:hypothetical protein
MTENLAIYFTAYADKAMQTMRECRLAKNYYGGIARRLKSGYDPGTELPAAKQIGKTGTQAVVTEATNDFSEQEKHAWDLPKILAEHAKSKVTVSVKPQELYPRYSVAHLFTTPAGYVKVFISTQGQNIKLDVSAGKNQMAAEAAMLELEKIISFSTLLSDKP